MNNTTNKFTSIKVVTVSALKKEKKSIAHLPPSALSL